MTLREILSEMDNVIARICRQREQDLEDAKNIHAANVTFRSKEDDVITAITLNEKECDSMRRKLDLKEKELSECEEKLKEKADKLKEKEKKYEVKVKALKEKRADVEKGLKNVLQQKEENLKLQQNEEEKLKNIKARTYNPE
ncbi:hypothetical protein TSUD_125880 [Trifolium subterraneum]|uniref:Uncharacterized protein n=1 Tax=Trifolium subterraneum TaxID=3900 RepID=A0A2Z6MRA4_TRISU|nr:hypothetical protein TSUD_125880 [Trifolium subterraneum]